MYLIVGLGNPGQKYQNTRHNLGFLTLQALARRHQISAEKRKFESHYGLGEILQEKVILLTPLTYMNLSGQAVGSFLRYFQISSANLIVIHDDLDLPWTRMRITNKGGAAGHKGLLSIIESYSDQRIYPDTPGNRPSAGKNSSGILCPGTLLGRREKRPSPPDRPGLRGH